MKAFTLTETLVTIALIALLASLLLPTLARAHARAKAWAVGAYAWQQARIEAYLGTNDAAQAYYATNTVKPWIFVSTRP